MFNMFSRCILCKSDDIVEIVRLENQPVVQNVYYRTGAEAQSMPRCTITIFACRNCQMMFNSSFDEGSDKKNYTADYKYSPPRTKFFEQYLESLARMLIEKYRIVNAQVAEIGCGRPEFLEVLAKMGNNTCLGIDPAAPAAVDDKRITLVQKLFDGNFFGTSPKLVILRQTVEHISNPVAFLKKIREALPEGAIVYIEVPSTEFSVEHKCLHDFYHEHVGYYTAASMRYLLDQAGFEPDNLYRSYGEQYISVIARAKQTSTPHAPQPDSSFMLSLNTLTATLEKLRSSAKKISGESKVWALWGGGAKGVTFSNIIDASSLANLIAVDANPDKMGVYMGGSGLKIYAPEELTAMSLETVVVMNALYKDEIIDSLNQYAQKPPRVVLYEDLVA